MLPTAAPPLPLPQRTPVWPPRVKFTSLAIMGVNKSATSAAQQLDHLSIHPSIHPGENNHQQLIQSIIYIQFEALRSLFPFFTPHRCCFTRVLPPPHTTHIFFFFFCLRKRSMPQCSLIHPELAMNSSGTPPASPPYPIAVRGSPGGRFCANMQMSLCPSNDSGTKLHPFRPPKYGGVHPPPPTHTALFLTKKKKAQI